MKTKKLQRALNSPLGSALGVVAFLVALFGWLRSDIGELREPVASLQTTVSRLDATVAELQTTVRALNEIVVSPGERVARVEGEQAAYRLLIPGVLATDDGNVPALLDLSGDDAQRQLSSGPFPEDFTPDMDAFEAFRR